MTPILELKNINYSYHTLDGETKALSDISFALTSGEFTAVVGPSGCGKSTLLSLIAGLMKPESGEIFLNGEPLTENSSKIGYMLQHDHLFEWRTVYRNVTLGAEIRGKVTPQIRARAEQLLEQYGLERFARSRPSELSGGMRQRVMIAMALACEPDILIADEPTTALDVTIQAQILELMQDLQKKLGMAIIMVTHDLGVIAELCDEIIVLYGGRVCERGTAEDIFYRPRHEYTKGLLRSIPNVDRIGEKLIPIPGTPINLLNMPRGCAFCPRCENAMKICIEQVPPEMQMPDGHYAACWLNVKEEMLAKQGGANK